MCWQTPICINMLSSKVVSRPPDKYLYIQSFPVTDIHMIYIPKWISKRYYVVLHNLIFTFEKSNQQWKLKFLPAAGNCGIYVLPSVGHDPTHLVHHSMKSLTHSAKSTTIKYSYINRRGASSTMFTLHPYIFMWDRSIHTYSYYPDTNLFHVTPWYKQKQKQKQNKKN